MSGTTAAEVMAELATLDDARTREVNRKHGDDHGVKRALAIGERLEVLKDFPTPPNCTSPYAPIWITEMVRRQP